MKPEAEREVLLFQAAAQLGAVERMQFLDLKCGDEKVLRRRVEALLAAHEGSRAFMVDLPDARATTRVDPGPIDDQPMEQTIGRYKIREKIGEGGCGVVYVAEQSVPIRRRVALKVIKLGMDTRQVVARFEAERQALALMDHPNIAKVLDAGATETGRPYFVMELVRGIRITDYCDENHLSTRDRLDLFVQVCNAIQHAHQKGIIHRDIKPSNILVTLHDGVPVPKVIDFGIAKATEARLTDSTLYTQLHQLLGTPAYMSPEQAEMSGLDVDTRSDIYSLGVLLYELLIGRTPFDAGKLIAAGVDAMRRTIRETEPLRPSTRLAALRGDDLTATAKRRRIDPPRLVYLIKGDLDWIVMRCLEKDRTRRYETANGLAMDIQRHLSDEPVVARPPSRTYRFVKTVRRNTGAFMAAGMVLAALVIGIVSSVSQTIRAKNAETRERTEAHRARRAEQIAEAERIRAERNLYAADMNIVQQALADANLRRARERLHAHETGGTQDLRGWEWYYLSGLARGDDVFSQKNTNSVVSILPLSLPNRVLIGWENGTLDLWDIAGRRSFAAAAQIEGGLRAAVIDASGEVIAAQSEGGTVGIWQLVPVGALKLLNSFHCPGTVRAISAARKLIAIVAEEEGRWEIADSDRGLIAIWNYETGQKLEVLPNSGAGAIFSTDGETLVTGSWRSSVQVWKTSDWSQQKTLRDVGRVLGMSMSPNGQWLLLNTRNGTFLCDLTRNSQPQLLDKISARDTTFRSQFSRDGTRFAAAFGDGEIGLWDLSSQKGINRLRGHEGWVDALAFSEDGQSLVSADRTTKTLRVFKVEPRTNDETVISLYTPAIFSWDGRFMAVGDKIGNNFNSTVWDWLPARRRFFLDLKSAEIHRQRCHAHHRHGRNPSPGRHRFYHRIKGLEYPFGHGEGHDLSFRNKSSRGRRRFVSRRNYPRGRR